MSYSNSNKKIIALIPARSGSKRVQNKNIKYLDGKPLIAHTIIAAKNANNIDRVIVSTDSKEIAEIAIEYGAEVPFLRPPEISDSDATEYDFHIHAIEELEKNENYKVDIIVNLYPTTPFRKVETINNALNLFLDNSDVDSLRSVRLCKEHPYKMWTQNGKYLNRLFTNEQSNKSTLSYHLLPKVYIQNASIYIVNRETLINYKNTIGEKTLMFEMSDQESLDINYEIDFEFANYLSSKKPI